MAGNLAEDAAEAGMAEYINGVMDKVNPPDLIPSWVKWFSVIALVLFAYKVFFSK